MQDNPYSPPRSALSDPLPGAGVASRPFAVWLLFVVLLIAEALLLTGLSRFALVAWVNFAGFSAALPVLLPAFLRIVLAAAATAALAFGVFRRKRWARWPSLLAIVGLIAYCIFSPDTTHYNNEAEQQGGAFSRYILLPLLLAWWAHACCFSAKAKRYFGVAAVTSKAG
ncbi:MAG: hypothetical protein QM776_14050 [Rhodocyclaceae bacterium]